MKKNNKYITVVISNKKKAIDFTGKKNAVVFGFECDVSDGVKIENFLSLVREQIIKFNY